MKSVLVAIINIDPDEVPKISKETGVPADDLTAFCQDQKVYDLFASRFAAAHKAAKLNGFERIKKFYIDPVQFIDNGLVTTTFKLKRNVAKEHYKKIIDQLYEGLD